MMNHENNNSDISTRPNVNEDSNDSQLREDMNASMLTFTGAEAGSGSDNDTCNGNGEVTSTSSVPVGSDPDPDPDPDSSSNKMCKEGTHSHTPHKTTPSFTSSDKATATARVTDASNIIGNKNNNSNDSPLYDHQHNPDGNHKSVSVNLSSQGTQKQKQQHNQSIQNGDKNLTTSSTLTVNLAMTPDADLLSPPNLMRKVAMVHVRESSSSDASPSSDNSNDNANATLNSTARDNVVMNTNNDDSKMRKDHSKQISNATGNDNTRDGTSLSPIRKLSPLFLHHDVDVEVPLAATNDNENDTHECDGDGHDDKEVNDETQPGKESGHAFKFRFQRRDEDGFIYRNNAEDNDHDNYNDASSDSANSLISEYGSDIGEIKLRMDDVHAMDALVEDVEEEEDGNNDELEGGEKEEEEEDRFINQKRKELGALRSLDTNSNCDAQSLYSVNLLSSSSLAELPTINEISLHNPIIRDKVQNISKRHEFQIKREHNTDRSASPIAPNTPISAVSAAIRRLGNGVVNQMTTRCNNNEENASSTSEYEEFPFNDIYQQRHRNMWLSPRFGHGHHADEFQPSSPSRSSCNSSHHVLAAASSSSEINQHAYQPQMVTTPSQTRSQNTTTNLLSSPLRHIRGCFSFDPESGTLPYATRIHSSPPSSPLVVQTHRKSKSWCSVNSGAATQMLSNHWKGSDDSKFNAPNHYHHHLGQSSGSICVEMSNAATSNSPSTPSRNFVMNRIISSPKKKSKANSVVALGSPQVRHSNKCGRDNLTYSST